MESLDRALELEYFSKVVYNGKIFTTTSELPDDLLYKDLVQSDEGAFIQRTFPTSAICFR